MKVNNEKRKVKSLQLIHLPNFLMLKEYYTLVKNEAWSCNTCGRTGVMPSLTTT